MRGAFNLNEAQRELLGSSRESFPAPSFDFLYLLAEVEFLLDYAINDFKFMRMFAHVEQLDERCAELEQHRRTAVLLKHLLRRFVVGRLYVVDSLSRSAPETLEENVTSHPQLGQSLQVFAEEKKLQTHSRLEHFDAALFAMSVELWQAWENPQHEIFSALQRIREISAQEDFWARNGCDFARRLNDICLREYPELAAVFAPLHELDLVPEAQALAIIAVLIMWMLLRELSEKSLQSEVLEAEELQAAVENGDTFEPWESAKQASANLSLLILDGITKLLSFYYFSWNFGYPTAETADKAAIAALSEDPKVSAVEREALEAYAGVSFLQQMLHKM